MTVIAICMVKDEADIVTDTIGWMLDQVDEVIVADNGSTDGTRDLLEQLPVTLFDDPEVGYYQSRKMTALAARAAQLGADWVLPMDADEVWYSPHGRIADVLGRLDADTVIARADVYDHVATAADPDVAPARAMGWRRREANPLVKVACRATIAATIEQGNHGAHYPAGIIDEQLVVRHFPYRSAAQFVNKARNGAAAYAATDLPEEQGAHWRQYGAILNASGPAALEDVFRRWFWAADPAVDPALIYDPAPTCQSRS